VIQISSTAGQHNLTDAIDCITSNCEIEVRNRLILLGAGFAGVFGICIIIGLICLLKNNCNKENATTPDLDSHLAYGTFAQSAATSLTDAQLEESDKETQVTPSSSPK